MKNVFLETGNVSRFEAAMGVLRDTDAGQPGLGVVWGRAGRGKTMAARRHAVSNRAVYLRALQDETPTAMLSRLCGELVKIDGATPRTASAAKTMACGLLDKSKRPVLVDEADRLKMPLVEHLRDIHDLTGVPVVFVGEDSLWPMLNSKRRIWSRVTQAVEFGPVTSEDVMLYASKAAGLSLAPEAALALEQRSEGDFRLLHRDMAALSRMAKTARIHEVSADMIQALPSLNGGRHGR